MSVTARGWKRTAVRLQRIARSLDREVPDTFVRMFAEQVQFKLQEGIRRQTFKLSPLSRRYLQKKVADGYDRRVLMRSGKYVDSIKVVRTSPKAWGVGIDGRVKTSDKRMMMWELVNVLEFGNRTGTIPARPHWRPVIAWVKKAWPRYVPGRIRDRVHRSR